MFKDIEIYTYIPDYTQGKYTNDSYYKGIIYVTYKGFNDFEQFNLIGFTDSIKPNMLRLKALRFALSFGLEREFINPLDQINILFKSDYINNFIKQGFITTYSKSVYLYLRDDIYNNYKHLSIKSKFYNSIEEENKFSNKDNIKKFFDDKIELSDIDYNYYYNRCKSNFLLKKGFISLL